METNLEKINSVIGVTGSFVCLDDGSIAARALPDSFDATRVALAASIVSQMFQAFETSGQRIAEADLSFDQGRLILKNLRGGVLVILCARKINLPLLNQTTNLAAKKLTDTLKTARAPSPAPVTAPAMVPASAPVPSPVPVAAPAVVSAPAPVPAPTPLARPTDNALFVELEREWQQIQSEAATAKATLRVMSSLAIWLCCPQSRTLLAPPEKKQLDFAARATQRESIRRVLDYLGYQATQSPDEFYSSPRLYFSDPERNIVAEVYLGTFAMYHQLDLMPFLVQQGNTLSETALCLIRLQLVEMPESGLRELCALLLDHDLSRGIEKDKIDVSQIARLCCDHWGWYKTVTMNLERIATFALNLPTASEQATIGERARRIRKLIEETPKSLRWQARARLGEGVRWYEIPVAATTQEQRQIHRRSSDESNQGSGKPWAGE